MQIARTIIYFKMNMIKLNGCIKLLFHFKDNIPDPVIQKIQPYIDNEDFQPANIAKVNLKTD